MATKMLKAACALFLLLFLPGCSTLTSTNNISTETYYDQHGNIVKVVENSEVSDDALYYTISSETMIAESKNTCAPNCAPGELASIEAFRTIRSITGNTFVPKGKNLFEVVETLGTAAIQQAPLGILAFGVSKVASKPNNVSLEGDNSTYSPIEAHWTANSGEGDYSAPITLPVNSSDFPE